MNDKFSSVPSIRFFTPTHLLLIIRGLIFIGICSLHIETTYAVDLRLPFSTGDPAYDAELASRTQEGESVEDIIAGDKETAEQNHPLATMFFAAATGAIVASVGNLATQQFLKGDKDGSGGPSGFGGGDFNFDPNNYTNPATQESLNRAADGLRRAEEGLGGRDKLVDVLENPDKYLTDKDKAKLASMADSALGGSGISPDTYYGDASQMGSGEDPYSFMGSQKQGDVSHRLSYLTDSMNGQFPAGGIPGVYAYNQVGRSGGGGLFGSGGSGLDANGLLSSFFPNKNGMGGSLGSSGMRSLAAAEGHGKGGTANGAYSLPDGAPLIFQAVHYYTPRFVQYNQLKQAQAKMEDEARAKRLLSAASSGNDATVRTVSARETMIVSQPLSHQAAIGITAGAPLGVGIKVKLFPPDMK